MGNRIAIGDPYMDMYGEYFEKRTNIFVGTMTPIDQKIGMYV